MLIIHIEKEQSQQRKANSSVLIFFHLYHFTQKKKKLVQYSPVIVTLKRLSLIHIHH